MVQTNSGAPVVVTNGISLEGIPTGESVSTSGNQQLIIAAIGSPSDAAWNGNSPNATVIALLKAIAQNTSVS